MILVASNAAMRYRYFMRASLHQTFVFLTAATTLAGFTASAQTPAPAPRKIENILVSSAVPDNQMSRIQADIDYLKTLDFSKADPDLLSLMGITTATPDTLLAWLETRVHYLVDENLNTDTAMAPVANSTFVFPNPGILPVIEEAPSTPATSTSTSTSNSTTNSTHESDVVTVMLNIGGGIYLEGKFENKLMGLAIPGFGTIEVTSPRAGIIQVGAGMFAQLLPDDSLTPDSKPYITLRLSTLFHEAHHSDGNGTSLGFVHAICPSGTYAGYYACDRNLLTGAIHSTYFY
jgi:hypothetical protein